MGPVLQPTGERLIAAMALAEACVVLDLGTGTGALLPSLQRAAPKAGAWIERPERRWTVPELLDLSSRYGATSRRLGTLDSASRTECVAGVSEALAALTPEELVYRPEMLLAVAVRP